MYVSLGFIFILWYISDFLLLLPSFLHLFIILVLGAVIFFLNAYFISAVYKTE